MKYCAFVLFFVVVVGVMSQTEAQIPSPHPPSGTGGPYVGHQLQFAKIYPGKQAGCRDGGSSTAAPTTAGR
ncbi:hypothetical protein ILUMI_19199 [Ignelater luminosus]|uniref:Secreted protein n=1 Tax=Ignelater luminosus TaxID=2038154 RepID=A0A8K0CGL7_IGNLU|nr:hypothetical protein ILUMI_19199 [Ignelater luminosus]